MNNRERIRVVSRRFKSRHPCARARLAGYSIGSVAANKWTMGKQTFKQTFHQKTYGEKPMFPKYLIFAIVYVVD